MKNFMKAFTSAAKHNDKNDKKKSFQISYKKMNGRTVKRKIDPYNIRGNLVIAWDHKRKAIRSFKIDKVKSMEKSAFWNGFEKIAIKSHALAVAGGALAGGIVSRKHYLDKGRREGAQAVSDYYNDMQSQQKQAGLIPDSIKSHIGEHATHAAELAGLGVLAYHPAKDLLSGKKEDKGRNQAEVGGLGILAAPSIHHFGKALLNRGK